MCVVVEKVHFFAAPEWIRTASTRARPDSGFGARAPTRAKPYDASVRREAERERERGRDERARVVRLQKFVTTRARPSQGMEFSFQPAIFQAQLRLHSFGYNPMRKDAARARGGRG